MATIKTSLSEKIGYGFGDMACSAFCIIFTHFIVYLQFTLFLPHFYIYFYYICLNSTIHLYDIRSFT